MCALRRSQANVKAVTHILVPAASASCQVATSRLSWPLKCRRVPRMETWVRHKPAMGIGVPWKLALQANLALTDQALNWYYSTRSILGSRRVRLAAQDTALSRRRSRVRIPYALP